MEIKLTKAQSQVWVSDARFKVCVSGRRFGKSYLSLTWLINQAANTVGVHYYVAPSFVMAKQIAWRLLKELVGEHATNKNESELLIELPNGSVIQLKGAENRDALRGVSLASLVLDEFAFMQKEVWTEVLRPATSDQQAPVLFITSPAGWNWAKDLYDYAESKVDENWESFTFTTADGGNVKQEEIEAAKRELPLKTFQQEYLASFTTLANRVYSNFDRVDNVSSDLVKSDNLSELYIGMDFNITPMTCVIGSKVGDQLHIIDEISIDNSNTTEMSQEIKKRYPNHRIRVYPDPAGRARKTSAAGGVTDFTILQEAGFNVIAPSKHPAVADRVNEVQAMLCNANGARRLFIHPRCSFMIKCLDGLTYKKDTSQPDKASGLDHMVDALGYLVHSEFPIIKPVTNVSFSF